jgi:hypothetical protein
MAPISPVQAARVQQLAQVLATAPHGGKGALCAAAAADLGVSPQTVSKWLNAMSIRNPRKRRSDAGSSALSRDEASAISVALLESLRRNGKRLLSVEQTLDMLRANDLIRAERIDPATGECKPLSNSAIARALRTYGLHPDQLLRPAAAMTLASRHPNHVWQIDASLCVLYYLPRQTGLQVMDADTFYKNKPANVAKIEQDRVWRYAVTDHASGHVYVEYVLGAESGENLATVFINAIQKREGAPVHGVPLMAMLDPGSANTGALFKNLCRALQVRVQINQVGNPRAKGQVEKAHDLIEKSFESRLKFVRVETLAQLNAEAARWMRSFNGTSVMARHGMTRYEAWLKITAEQLRIAPEVAICRELATSAPEERTVSDLLQISYRGQTYDVAAVPDVQNGDKVMVCRNPWRPEAAQVIDRDAEGREVYYVIEPVAKDAWGFATASPVIGETYRRHADTPAQTAAKAIEKLAMGEATLEGAAAARKGKRLAFDGRIDPWKDVADKVAALPAYIAKRGTPLDTPLPGIAAAPSTLAVPAAMAVEAARLNHTQMAMAMSRESWWATDLWPQMVRLYPEGVFEADLPAVAESLRAVPRLRAVG